MSAEPASHPLSGRLSTLAAAFVIARRDFVASVRSRSFIMFLLSPLFMVALGALAGGAGREVPVRPIIGLAMSASDDAAMIAARRSLADHLVGEVPEFAVVPAGEAQDPRHALGHGGGAMAAIISGTPDAPKLTTTQDRLEEWRGMVALIAAKATSAEIRYPTVDADVVASSAAQQSTDQQSTGKLAQTLVFVLTMMLAGNVLSNLIEEKGNKIIEVLAAAIPLEALYFGKLLAMLAMSFLGVAVWGAGGAALVLWAGNAVPALAAPAVGWPVFAGLTAVYFAMAYLLLGAIYLAIGGLAATIRDIQTLALPASLLQMAMFFFALFGTNHANTSAALAARIFPLSSPFAMAAVGASNPALWPHLLAIGWQMLFLLVFIIFGARLFRARVMKSGPAGAGPKPRRAFSAKPAKS